VDHQKTVQLLQWEISFGQNADLQKFAADTLPTVLRHLELAQQLGARLNGQTPREMSARTPAPAANGRTPAR
jgi:putative membrane protein